MKVSLEVFFIFWVSLIVRINTGKERVEGMSELFVSPLYFYYFLEITLLPSLLFLCFLFTWAVKEIGGDHWLECLYVWDLEHPSSSYCFLLFFFKLYSSTILFKILNVLFRITKFNKGSFWMSFYTYFVMLNIPVQFI